MSRPSNTPPRLLWLFSESLVEVLDAATWLETTRELRAAGWRVDLVMAGNAGETSVDDVEVIPLQRPPVYLWGQIAYHLRFLRLAWSLRRDLDVIMVHPISVPWLLPVKLARVLAGARRPLLVMDSRSLHMPGRDRQSVKDRLRESFNDLVYRTVRYVTDGRVTITRRLAEATGLTGERYWGVWPSGVRPGPFVAAAAARCWPGVDDALRLVYVGSLSHERHLAELCSAVLAANKAGARLQLLLVGDGGAADDLKIVAAGSGGAIDLRPPVAHAEVPAVLASAHVGVLPFPDEEKFRVSSPIKLFEYLASGLPILATRIVCHTDVLDGTTCTFWAESADVAGLRQALELAWDQRQQLRAMGAVASDNATAWTWSAAAEKLRAAIEPHFDKQQINSFASSHHGS